MRILLDYRPALRERTGVGEYVHEIAAALDRLRPSTDVLTLFSSSWKDRVTRVPVPRDRVVDARIPVTLLNLAWHRLEFPPVEWLAGQVDVAHSPSPLMIPTWRAARVVTIHDLDFLDHPERTRHEIRRDYGDLAPSHASRADAIVVVSKFTAGEVVNRLGVPRDRITVCPPGAPPWAARDVPQPDGPILFMGTLEPRKNVGALLGAYGRLRFMLPSVPPLILAGGDDPISGPVARRDQEATPGGTRPAPGLRRSRSALRPLRSRVDARAAVPRRGIRPAGARSDDGRPPGHRQPAGGAARGGRRRRYPRRTGRSRGAGGGDAPVPGRARGGAGCRGAGPGSGAAPTRGTRAPASFTTRIVRPSSADARDDDDRRDADHRRRRARAARRNDGGRPVSWGAVARAGSSTAGECANSCCTRRRRCPS